MSVCVGCGLEVVGDQLQADLKPGGNVSCNEATGLSAAFTGSTAAVLTNETTTSTSYTDLATVGPTVTVTTRTAAWVAIDCATSSGGTAGVPVMSVAVSGATTIAADDNRAIFAQDIGIFRSWAFGYMALIEGLAPGVNTFTAKYRTFTGTVVAFANRRIIVIP